MINGIENVVSFVDVSLMPFNILPNHDEFIRFWVPMVIDSDDDDELLESGEEEEEEEDDEESDINEDDIEDEED
jgi:hypothetical protein